MKHLILICLLAFASSASALEIIWDRSGASDSSHYGQGILPLGDQNHDGFSDWAVWAGGNFPFGTIHGMVEFFHGGNPLSPTPYMTVHNSLASWDAAGVLGDVNGDGYVDWFTKSYTDSHGIYQVNIYFGGPSADTLSDLSLLIGWQDYFGTVGDFNGDGRSDVYWYHYYEDYVNIFYGNTVMSWIPDWTKHSPEGEWNQAMPISCGDLNDDGSADWVSVELQSNTTYIFWGGAIPDTIPAYIWPNLAVEPLAIVNDMNGDHFAELVYWNRELHFGRPQMRSAPDMTFDFPCGGTNAEYGTGVGDINGDGYGDMVLYRTNCDDWPGGLGLYLGHPWINPGAAVFIRGEGWQNLHGIGAATGLGDVNGDGIDEWAIGSWDQFDQLGWRGRCIVIKGDTTLVAGAEDPFILPPTSFSLSCFPNPFNATTTISFTLPKTEPVDLNVYDVMGRLVRQLAGGHIGPPLQAGTHDIAFDGSNLSSGIYFVRLQSGTVSQTQKIVLLK